MSNYLIIPGLGNSGPEHWQSYFEKQGPEFHRVMQTEWDAPRCEDWIRTLDRAIQGFNPEEVVLIGHSLGCATIIQWYHHYKRTVKAAMLVAPSDPEADVYTFPATGFAPLPLDPIPFPSVLVTSENDVWVSPERARLFARSWNSRYISLGNAGHINVASGHGPWEEGLVILKAL